MVSDWIEVQLQDIVTKLGDGLHGTPKYSENGEYYFINGNNLENGQIVFKEQTKRVDHTQYLKYKKELNERTLLVSINGTIGNVAYYNGEKVVLGKSACYFNLKDDIDKGYVRYVLSGHYFQSYLHAFATGTTIKNVSLKSMREFSFPIPPLPEQKAIAHILGSLDDKIELNRQMNGTLEAMAQALFKSWFIDFDPVIDNALAAGNAIPDEFAERAEQRKSIERKDNLDIHSLFPDEFELTEEIGWIPKGWGISEVKDFGQVVCGKTPSKKKAEYYGNDISFIKIPDMHDVAWATTTTDNLSFEGSNSQKNKLIPKGSICVSCIATVGKVLITSREAHTNQQINSVIPAEKNTLYYLYSSFLAMEKNLQDLASGGAVTLNLNTSNFSKIKIILPPSLVLDAYDSAVNSLYVKNLKLLIQNQELAKIRDTLLPKLMSGELRIPDAAAFMDEVK